MGFFASAADQPAGCWVVRCLKSEEAESSNDVGTKQLLDGLISHANFAGRTQMTGGSGKNAGD
ncbi:hypothetical protein, partial [Mesorhizobium sp.]|uniref:hypothetical protein n=1 Tax=Mesorhizobium sp. TaxID=1871066 RepID=UPI0025ED3816